MTRNDVDLAGQAPDYVQKKLLDLGGKNPYGEPVFRFVRSEHVRHLQGGHWHEWPEGTPLKDRGGLAIEDVPDDVELLSVTPKENKPLRIVTEVRWVEKYPSVKGWVLEEWRPAHCFGTPEAWVAYKVPGTELPQLGPYPSEGQYEMAAPNIMQEIPPLDAFEEAIAYIHQKREEQAQIPVEVRIKLRLEQMTKQAELRERLKFEEDRARIKDHLRPYFGSSRESGALRSKLGEQAGIRSHVGN